MKVFIKVGICCMCLLAGLIAAVSVQSGAVEPQVGFARIRVESGSVPVASALFSFSNPRGTLVSEAAVAARPSIANGRIFIDQDGQRTGIGFANPSDSAVEVDLVLRDATGRIQATSRLNLGAGRQQALFVDDPRLFPEFPSAFSSGSLTFEVVSGHAGIGAVTLRQTSNRHGEPLLATLPVASLSQAAPSGGEPASIVFPHLGVGGILSSRIVLINPSGEPIVGRIRLAAQDGEPLEVVTPDGPSSEIPFRLEAHGTFQAELAGSQEILQGYAIAAVEEGLVLPEGTVIFQFRDSTGGLASEAGVSAVLPTTRARLLVDTAGTQTGLAVANPGEESAVLQLRLLNRNGSIRQQTERILAAGTQEAFFVDEVFADLPAAFTGLLEVMSTTPIHPLTLKLTVTARGDFILTTLPVADWDHPPTGAELIVAHLGFGPVGELGEFSTRLILINAGLSDFSQGAVDFFDSEGAPLPLPERRESNRLDFRIAGGGVAQLRPGNTARPVEIITPNALAELNLNRGSSFSFNPVVLDSDGNPRDDFSLSWASVDTDVASVDEFGRVEARQAGFATLILSTGTVVRSLTVTVVGVTSSGSAFEVRGVAADLAGRVYLTSEPQHAVLLTSEVGAVPEVYAGVAGTPGFRDQARLQALFRQPAFLAYDQGRGLLYVTDSTNHAIRAVEPGLSGRVLTLAGSGNSGSSDGTGVGADFNHPQGLTLDPGGRLWVADAGNHTIRWIDLSSGIVETVAGLAGESGNRDGSGSEARFAQPVGITLESEPAALRLAREMRGEPPPPIRVLVADSGNRAIRRVFEDGRVETLQLQSNATAAPAGAPLSQLASPEALAVDSLGVIQVTEPAMGAVRTLLPGGAIVDLAESGTFLEPLGVGLAGEGRVVVADRRLGVLSVDYGTPEITRLEPESVSSDETASIVVEGRNFAPESIVLLGSVIMSEPIVENTTRLSFQLPAGFPSGRTTLTVQNRGGIAQIPLAVSPPSPGELEFGEITTIAGGSTFAGDGGQGVRAAIQPFAVAIDTFGNLWVSDPRNHRVRRLDIRSGIVNTVAGTGIAGLGSDGTPGLVADLNFPTALTFDGEGRLIFLETGNARVLRFDPSTGLIERLAGGRFADITAGEDLGDGGAALLAGFNNLLGLALDRERGILYLSDSLNHRVRAIDLATQLISTVAGGGNPADELGDGLSATRSALDLPVGLAVDKEGHLYVADRNHHRVRRVDAVTGVITTFAGNGQDGFSGDGGPASEAALSNPFGVAVDPDGQLFIADSNNYRVRRVDRAKNIVTVAGGTDFGFSGDGGPAQAAVLGDPASVALDASGNVFIVDAGNFRIRRIEAGSETIDTILGNGERLLLGDGGPATLAALRGPETVAVGDGVIYISDLLNERIRQVDLQGIITTVAGAGDPDQAGIGNGGPAADAIFSTPQGLAWDGGASLFVADTFHHLVRRIDLNTGLIGRLAGTAGVPGFSGDGGGALQALLSEPLGLAFDPEGFLLVVDSGNRRVRRIDLTTGIIATVAGGGTSPPGSSGGSALDARLEAPRNLGLDAAGNFYLTDLGARRVLRVSRDGIITTVAGGGGDSSSEDIPATEAELLPLGLAVEADGGFYVTDLERVRRVSSEGSIRTVAGILFAPGFSGDGGAATQTRLDTVRGLALDAQGNLYLADTGNNRIRIISIQ